MSKVVHTRSVKTTRMGRQEDLVIPACVKLSHTGRMAVENPFDKEEWCQRTVEIKVANANTYARSGNKFEESHMEGLVNADSDTDEEDIRYNRKLTTTGSDKFYFAADLKKRPRQSGLMASPGVKLPRDVEVLLDDMDLDMQVMVINAVKEAIREYPNEEDEGALRAKRIKLLLDERLEASWHCCVISDRFWAGCSFQPGYTFAFELGNYTYLVWKTPGGKFSFAK